jgi:hypothetical protein
MGRVFRDVEIRIEHRYRKPDISIAANHRTFLLRFDSQFLPDTDDEGESVRADARTVSIPSRVTRPRAGATPAARARPAGPARWDAGRPYLHLGGEYRWYIEEFFGEARSDLGMGHYETRTSPGRSTSTSLPSIRTTPRFFGL